MAHHPTPHEALDGSTPPIFDERPLGQVGLAESARLSEAGPNLPLDLAELHPEWPKLHATILFGAHESPGDVQEAAEAIGGAQVYLCEAAASSKLMARILQIVADDESGSEVFGYVLGQATTAANWEAGHNIYEIQGLNPFLQQVAGHIHGSQIAVGSIDLGPDQKNLSKDIQSSVKGISSMYNWRSRHHDFADVSAFKARTFREMGEQNIRREAIMAERFEPEMQRIFEDHPQLLELTDLNIAMTMGAAHAATLYEKLNARYPNVFSQTAIGGREPVFANSHELIMDVLQGREVDSLKVARAMLEDYLMIGLITKVVANPGEHADNLAVIAYIRDVADKFSETEIARIFDSRDAEELGSPKAYIAVDQALAAKSIDPLPTKLGDLHARGEAAFGRRDS
jgi:hypothetical protein